MKGDVLWLKRNPPNPERFAIWVVPPYKIGGIFSRVQRTGPLGAALSKTRSREGPRSVAKHESLQVKLP